MAAVVSLRVRRQDVFRRMFYTRGAACPSSFSRVVGKRVRKRWRVYVIRSWRRRRWRWVKYIVGVGGRGGARWVGDGAIGCLHGGGGVCSGGIDNALAVRLHAAAAAVRRQCINLTPRKARARGRMRAATRRRQRRRRTGSPSPCVCVCVNCIIHIPIIIIILIVYARR